MLPDLNRLRVFVCVYSEGSVVGAARALHVTQSAVSQSLKKLEKELGMALFTRLHKRLVPTGEGELLYGLARPFLEQLERGVEGLQRGREVPSGRLRIGAPREFGQVVLPGLFASFREGYPEVWFAMELGHPTELLPQLEGGQLELAFVDVFSVRWGPMRAMSLFGVEPMFEESLILVAGGSWLEALGQRPGVEQLRGATFLAYKPHMPSLRSWFVHHWGERPGELEVALVVESVKALIEAAIRGLGLAVVPRHLVEGELASGALCCLDPGDEADAMKNQISLLQLQDKIPSLAQKAFVSHCKEALNAGAPGARRESL